MADRTFTVDGATYQAGRLDAFVQNHIARKLAPVWIFIGARQKPKAEAGAVPPTPPSAADTARFIVTSSGNLPNEDVDYVIGACLSVVRKQQQGGAWAPVRAPNGALMFPFDLLPLMEIVWNVVEQHGIVDFFYDAPSDSSAAAAGPKSTG